MGFSDRYSRQLQLKNFGVEAQQKLAEAKVLVIGAGGLGIPAMQYLTGMGVGTLAIADGDIISLSNLHRQVLYAGDEVGKLKVEIAEQKLKKLNPDINIQTFKTNITTDNALEIINDYDVIIDATDNFSARYLINDACVILGKPFIYGAIQQYEGHLSVFNYQEGPTYRCLYPSPPSTEEIPNCNEAGVLGVTPGIIGCQQALQAVKLITGVGKILSGTLQVFDFLNDDEYHLKLKTKAENKLINQLQSTYDLNNCSKINNIKAKDLSSWYLSNKDFFMLDVREAEEYAQYHLEGANLVPLNQLPAHISSFPADRPIVVVCQSGIRSQKAAALLSTANPELEIYHLEGGLKRWMAQAEENILLTNRKK